MVYDMTIPDAKREPVSATQKLTGFAIHENPNSEHVYAIYTDDGRGNGDYICGASDIYWIRRIAQGLDSQNPSDFDYNGIVIQHRRQ